MRTSCLLISALGSLSHVLHAVSMEPLHACNMKACFTQELFEINLLGCNKLIKMSCFCTAPTGCVEPREAFHGHTAGRRGCAITTASPCAGLSAGTALNSCLHPPLPLKTVPMGFYKEGNYIFWDDSSTVN